MKTLLAVEEGIKAKCPKPRKLSLRAFVRSESETHQQPSMALFVNLLGHLTLFSFLFIVLITFYIEFFFFLRCFQLSSSIVIPIRRILFVLQGSWLSRAYCMCCFTNSLFLFLLENPARLCFPASLAAGGGWVGWVGRGVRVEVIYSISSLWPGPWENLHTLLHTLSVCRSEEEVALEESGSCMIVEQSTSPEQHCSVA